MEGPHFDQTEKWENGQLPAIEPKAVPEAGMPGGENFTAFSVEQ